MNSKRWYKVTHRLPVQGKLVEVLHVDGIVERAYCIRFGRTGALTGWVFDMLCPASSLPIIKYRHIKKIGSVSV